MVFDTDVSFKYNIIDVVIRVQNKATLIRACFIDIVESTTD